MTRHIINMHQKLPRHLIVVELIAFDLHILLRIKVQDALFL